MTERGPSQPPSSGPPSSEPPSSQPPSSGPRPAADTRARPLFETWPILEGRVPWTPLGDFPTKVEPLAQTAARLGASDDALFVKRDDLSSPIYGGNKVRTLEALFGQALADGVTRIHSTGAFGSNHAAATVLHAPRAGLEGGVILFPQPRSPAAVENLRVILKTRPTVRALAHWSLLPVGMALTARSDARAGVRSAIMVPGGATANGALGYVSAGLELAMQVDRGELPAPRTVVIGVGSTCTSAGLLVGMRAAAELGLGWSDPPTLVCVRVTPWPVTSAFRIVGLARETAKLLALRTGEARWAFSRRTLDDKLEVDGRQLGRGYGHPTEAGVAAVRLFEETAGFSLDTTYSAKAAAGALTRAAAGRGPVLFWSTKSTAPLPVVTEDDWRWAPRSMTRWIER